MSKQNQKDLFINSVLTSALKQESLRELFERKLEQLEITPTGALDVLGISYRTLKGILEGTQKTFDHTNLLKLANLLQEPREKIVKLYLDSLEENNPNLITTTPEKIKFIKDHFDLAILKKDRVIDTLTDFEHIEKRIVSRLGLKSIFEYRKPSMDVAFSSGLFKQKNEFTRSFWIAAAKACLEEVDNPYEYDRQGLIDYFPQIRWHSTDVQHGLLSVVRNLYKLGVTVIYQPPLHTLQLRGATFSVNDKPCVVLTNYVGFYATLWFALVHELIHVLFDWEEIRNNKYHLTDDGNENLAVKEKEAETDKYARKYLFSIEKTNAVKAFINNSKYVEGFAKDNHVEKSLVYTFYAYDAGSRDRMAWARARRYSPPITESIAAIDLPWSEKDTIDNILKKRKANIYN